MPVPIALQLYSVRQALARDFAGVVRQVAAIGYTGVETAGFPGTTPQAAAKLLRELGLAVPAAHVPLPVGDKQKEALATAAALGCRYLVSGLGPDQFKTLEQVKHSCETFNQVNAAIAAHGLQFVIHNHWWEFQKVGKRYVYQVMLEYLDPTVLFEIDTYWVKTAGIDPATVVREFGPRAPLLHIKDGPAVTGQPMVAVGDGVMDFPAIIQAGGAATKWLIVELDDCATDMMAAVTRSYHYLLQEGLGRGRTG